MNKKNGTRKVSLVIFFVTLVFLIPGFPEKVMAEILLQQRGTLERGDSVLQSDGSLYDQYSFEGQAGQRVTIMLESAEFDTYLLLVALNGNTVAQNDDASSTNINSTLSVTLPMAGIYKVIANSYNRNNLGQYTLTVSTTGDMPSRTATTLESSSTPNNPVIEEGTYWVGATGIGLRVEGDQYQYYDENGQDSWRSTSELKYIREGVVFGLNYYWCLSTLPQPNTRTARCSATGWVAR